MNRDCGVLPELLAPAGNFDCLRVAAAQGADAVYLSGKSFGARSYADNFTEAELRAAVRYAHIRGIDVHVTVNTLLNDRELDKAARYLEYLEEIGADAVIVQDLAVARLAARYAPHVKRHASTQMTVHSLDGARALADLGFSRVVLSRELSFDEIKNISHSGGIETEIFIHGAMCMSYSGQCLMSSVLGGRSGNRGKCAQPCRQLYSAGGAEGYYLSLKDMCLAERLRAVLESGAASLKIEGRMKGAAYVAAVTGVYRRCLDERRPPRKSEALRLEKIFYRGGLNHGYFDDKTGIDMFAFDKPDDPYKKDGGLIAETALSEAESRAGEYRIPVCMYASFALGRPSYLSVSRDGKVIGEAYGAAASAALSRPLDKGRVAAQLAKTGDSVFVADNIDISLEGALYLPVKELNALRRSALSQAEDNLCAGERKLAPPFPDSSFGGGSADSGFIAQLTNIGQYRAVREFENRSGLRFRLLTLPAALLDKNPERFTDDRERIIIDPPAIMRDSVEYRAMTGRLCALGFSKLMVHNIGGLFKDFELYASARMNITNAAALSIVLDTLGCRAAALSPELSLAQMRDILSVRCAVVNAYGYQPVMLTENCITKNLGGCPCGGGTEYLTDRFGTRFPIIRDGESCRSVLLNSRPTFMADKLGELRRAGAQLISLSFTIETPGEVERICRAYLCGDSYVPKEYTRLHFYKGAISDKI